MVTENTVYVRKVQGLQRGHARAMRHMPMDAERKFWWRVRDRRLAGYKFKRQFLIGKYIVDFVCPEHKLIVELDGGQHALRIAMIGRAMIFSAHGVMKCCDFGIAMC